MINNFPAGEPQPTSAFSAPSQPPSMQEPGPSGSRSFKIVIAIVVLLVVLAGGALAFAYVEKIGPFSVSAYTEDNFFSSLLEKSSQIDSLSYYVSAAFGVKPREEDAKPFTLPVSSTPDLREKYQNDVERAKNISTIISILKYDSYSPSGKESSYPASLKKLMLNSASKNLYGAVSINDPVSKKEYEYKTTENGKNFMLAVTFETSDALKLIKKSYGYVPTSTIIEGSKVTFTKDSPYYIYLSSEPPKPLLVSMQESLRSLPPDVSASLSVGASSDLRSEAAEWLFNVNAEGDFGDLTYKINADALRKDADYYLKINNIPSLFLGDLAGLKGKWIKISTKASSSTSQIDQFSTLGYLSKEVPEYEKSYQESKQNFIDLARQIIFIADKEKLVLFKKAPKHEKVEDRQLTRYKLSIRKEAILPFYTKVRDLINSNPKFKEFDSLADQGTIEYLQSKEFSEVFDYYNKNIDFIFWADASGFPAMSEITMRIVPPDTATQLADKQMELAFKIILKDINKPINIKAPEGATPVEQIMKDVEKNKFGYDTSGLAGIKSNLSLLRAEAELVYDRDGGYGKKAFLAGPCKQAATTLFGDNEIYSAINKATNDIPSSATCVSKMTGGKVGSYAVSVPLPDSPKYSWCVDSYGNSKQITGSVSADGCN